MPAHLFWFSLANWYADVLIGSGVMHRDIKFGTPYKTHKGA